MSKKLIKLFAFFTLILFQVEGYSQTISISGKVSEGGYGLPGVSVLVKGTTKGVSTDFDGNYTIGNVANDATLVFSYIGFKTKEVPVAGKSKIDVVMEEDAASLDEVVIVGYGTSSKRQSTSAISTIKGADVVNTVASNPTTALQGKLSGIQIEAPGGQLGGTPNVFIRGVNSLSNANPLYIIDGLFVNNMDYINPNDIEDISVLKDAAAAAIYGSRAANGVILIKTNHGRKGKDLQINFNSRIGVDSPSKKLDFINGQQYTDYLNQRFANDGSTSTVTYNGVNTDWQEESLQSGIVEDYGVSISGGGDNSSYFGH